MCLAAEGAESWQLSPVGYAQLDFRAFPGWNTPSVVFWQVHGDEIALRRMRLGVKGRWRRFVVDMSADVADKEWLKDAYVEWRPGKSVRLRVGHFKLPVSLEMLTSAANTDFVERSMLARELAPGRDYGVMLRGRPRSWLELQAGAFIGDDSSEVRRSKTTGVVRMVLSPLRRLDVGATYSQGRVEEDDEQKGFRGMSPTGFRFFDRLPVEGWRRRAGLALSYERRSLALNAELLMGWEQRHGQSETCEEAYPPTDCEDLPAVAGRGWAVSATWIVTGERKRRAIRPKRAFPRGAGALELGVRLEELRIDDTQNAGLPETTERAQNVRPSSDRVVTFGVSWWPERRLRIMGDVLVERFEDPSRAPEAERRGPYISFLTRLQLRLP
jgi:phosphate-selective porin